MRLVHRHSQSLAPPKIADLNAKFDGILGLAFPVISRNPDVPALIPHLKEKGILKNEVFSFFLGDNADGELSIGGYDKSKMQGDVTWVDLAFPGYWLVGQRVNFAIVVLSISSRVVLTATPPLLCTGRHGSSQIWG